MATVTLVQAARYDHTGINLMTAQPMNINLGNLGGGAVQFTCNNALGAINGATHVDITYNGNKPNPLHETIQVSSVMA